jgi:hypothetical protein
MSLRVWWQRFSRRGEHRAGLVRPLEVGPAEAATEARIEQRGADDALARARAADRFMAEFRNAFGLNGGREAHR